jgi:hypothetical protein
MRSGPVVTERAWPSAADPALAMILMVDSTEVPGLCRVTVRGHMPGPRGRPHDVELETMIWRAASPCS